MRGVFNFLYKEIADPITFFIHIYAETIEYFM
jgi:hypothetical protein